MSVLMADAGLDERLAELRQKAEELYERAERAGDDRFTFRCLQLVHSIIKTALKEQRQAQGK